MKRVIAILLLLVMIAGCAQRESADPTEEDAKNNSETIVDVGQSSEPISRDVFAMDTYMTLTAYGKDAQAALDEAEQELLRLDESLAAEREDSEIARLNKEGEAELSEDAFYLVKRSIELYLMTGGAFEIAIYPIKQLWGFTDQNYRVPGDDEIAAILPLADTESIRCEEEGRVVSLAKEGMKIDLGGIAKGYASSKLIEIFEAHGVKGMINLGGNVQVIGTKPDGSRWRVGIRRPEIKDETIAAKFGDSEVIGVLETDAMAVITSGGYERYFEEDGEIYHHIIDPDTGRPSQQDLISATIVSRDGTLADALSTAVYVMGTERAFALWRENSEAFDMILMDAEGKLYATEGIEGKFTSEESINWIRKQTASQ